LVCEGAMSRSVWSVVERLGLYHRGRKQEWR
jgi:hypothetical protein